MAHYSNGLVKVKHKMNKVTKLKIAFARLCVGVSVCVCVCSYRHKLKSLVTTVCIAIITGECRCQCVPCQISDNWFSFFLHLVGYFFYDFHKIEHFTFLPY